METEKTKFRILVFPWLGYSHVIPYLELSKTLSDRNFQIYFCSSAINLDLIKPNVPSDASIDFIELQIPSLPELPPEFHTTKNLPPSLSPTLIQAFQMSSPAFSEALNSTNPDLLIYDFFQPWAAKQALLRGIPSVYFATSGAAPFSFYYHQFITGDCSTYPYPEIYLLEHEKVDVRAPAEPVVTDADDGEFGFGVLNLSSEIILVRSSRGVEGKCIDYLSQLCQRKVIPTGSLIRETNEECEEIMEWLSKKDQASTVFICFGSEHFLTGDQVLEIGKALDMMSEINFIWAIKFDDQGQGKSLEDVLPEGFLDRVKGRGLVVQGWVPQAKVLQHESVGGFVSHCGWGSVIESSYFGMPVIGMPIRYDQPINARLMVDAGAGVEVKKDGSGMFRGEELGKAIGEVFGNRGEELRRGARNVKQKMKEEEEEAMDDVVKELLLLCTKGRNSYVNHY